MKNLFATLVLGVATVSATAIPNDSQTVQHVLNRITFGVRDGDVARVSALGLQRYIDQQLYPDRVPDPAMAARLAGLTTLGMSSREIAGTFEAPLLEARRAQKQDAKTDADPDAPKMPTPVQQRANSVLVELGQQKILRAVYSERQLAGSADRFLVQPLQRRCAEGARPASCSPSTSATSIRPHVLGPFPRPARRDREEPGDALLPRQLDERRIPTARIRRSRRARRGPFGAGCAARQRGSQRAATTRRRV